ncbi:Protein PAM71, chloroplastic, partial [Linum perenne]
QKNGNLSTTVQSHHRTTHFSHHGETNPSPHKRKATSSEEQSCRRRISPLVLVHLPHKARMRSVAVSEGRFIHHPHCSSPPPSLNKKHLNSRFPTSGLPFHYPSLVSSRCSRKCLRDPFQGSLMRGVYADSDNPGVGDVGAKNWLGWEELIRIMDGIGKRNSLQDFGRVESSKSHESLMKFVLLFGYLMFQGSDQAVAAAAELGSSGLQTIPYIGDLGDISTGFASAFLLIFFSELGDKTFFIAALLAARNSAVVVFAGTFGALGVMTVISVVLGRTFHYVDEILPFRFGDTDLPIDDIAAVCLLVYFGVSTLIDASSSDSMKAEDEQKEAEIAVSEFSGDGAGILSAANTIISTFALVFVAEWGDKSFFSTIGQFRSKMFTALGVSASHLALLLSYIWLSPKNSFVTSYSSCRCIFSSWCHCWIPSWSCCCNFGN